MGNQTESKKHRIQSIFNTLTSKKPIRQTIIAVDSLDKSFRWIGTKGIAEDGGKINQDTPFFLASIDKMYNAAIVLKFHQDNLLNLDESITSCLPAPLTRGLHQMNGVDYTEKITIRLLALLLPRTGDAAFRQCR